MLRDPEKIILIYQNLNLFKEKKRESVYVWDVISKLKTGTLKWSSLRGAVFYDAAASDKKRRAGNKQYKMLIWANINRDE